MEGFRIERNGIEYRNWSFVRFGTKGRRMGVSWEDTHVQVVVRAAARARFALSFTTAPGRNRGRKRERKKRG